MTHNSLFLKKIVAPEDIQKQQIDLLLLVEVFIANLDVAKTTHKSYKNGLRQFFVWFKKLNIYPSKETILQYKEMLEDKGLKPTTRALYMLAIRRFFSWLSEEKIFPNIAEGIKGPRQSACFLRDPLSIPQLKQLFAFIPRNTLIGKRDFAIINTMVRTGLRPIELERAKMEDLELKEGRGVFWVRGKGRAGKDECVVLHEQALQPLLLYLRCRNPNLNKPSDPLFSSESARNYGENLQSMFISKHVITPYMQKARIKSERIVPYSLRHTFACLSFQAGVSFYDIKLALRHKDPSSTMRYLKGIEREARMKATAERGVRDVLKKAGI